MAVSSVVSSLAPLPEPAESRQSGVSWPAVFAGAAIVGAIGLTLMTLGAGMGISSVSVWPGRGAPGTHVAAGAIVWIIFVQVVASALGGYVAGRLRTKWVSLHTHEVFFRDTAHGLLAWAAATLFSAAFLGAFAASVAADVAGRERDGQPGRADYYADSLFRPAGGASATAPAEVRSEASAILTRNLARPSMDAADRSYLAALVSSHTGLPQPEAERRVDTTAANERAAAEEARKALAHSLYWLVVALLAGAFAGSYAAVIGGRRRDFVWA